MKDYQTAKLGRRNFLKGAVLATGLTIVEPRSVRGTTANASLELGIIGCGGRGNYVAKIFNKETTSRVVALADPFEGPLEVTRQKYDVDEKRIYKGLDGYQQLITSNVDAVIITSPPYFHPEQVSDAIDAGKHVWCAKPVAVDVPGCKSIMSSGRRAAGKRSLFVDFQTRSSMAFLEAVKRIRRGDIGMIVSGQIYYQTSRLRPKCDPGDTSPRGRLCNWVFDKVLSGDIIVEQNVHVLDVSDWYLNQRPIKSFGTGGRKARTDVGDCWDHFVNVFWYPDSTRIGFSSGQYLKGYRDLCMRIYGTEGTVDSHYGGSLKITGDHPWQGVERDNTGYAPVVRNAKQFEESIRSGELLNNAEQSAESSITTILGRTAAYEERVVTREEILAANVKLEANLKF